MNREIERKFLVCGDGWKSGAVGVHYLQGYIPTASDCTVRVRVMGDHGVLTLKGPTQGISRAEYEYPIPVVEALEMLHSLCILPLIEKMRYTRIYNKHTWEIDQFHGENEGLILAELELEAEDESFEIPPWIGDEVSSSPAYRNSRLVLHPYMTWNH